MEYRENNSLLDFESTNGISGKLTALIHLAKMAFSTYEDI